VFSVYIAPEIPKTRTEFIGFMVNEAEPLLSSSLSSKDYQPSTPTQTVKLKRFILIKST